MKPMIEPESDEALRKLLGQWPVKTPLPARFQEQVWKRIERAEIRPESASWTRLRNIVDLVLPRPEFALAYLSLLLVTGVAAGALAAQHKTTRMTSDLSLRYVQSIDPYLADASQR